MSSIVDEWGKGARALLKDDLKYWILEADAVAHSSAQISRAQLALRRAGYESPISVASVLLPNGVLRSNLPLNDRLLMGVKTFARLRARRRRPISGWKHTYFERLVGKYGKKDGSIEDIGSNHISAIASKITSWRVDVSAGLYAHTNLPTDKLRPRGAPCLQYIQVELRDADKFTLNALYRSHDYGNKCLGNLIGLCRLGALISQETDREFDRLRVISLNPFLPDGRRIGLEGVLDGLGIPR